MKQEQQQEQDRSAALALLNGYIGRAAEVPEIETTDLEAAHAAATIDVTREDGTAQSRAETVELGGAGATRYFPPPGPCRVKIAAGLRMQLVKFELSAEIHVGLEIPCAGEAIDEAARFAQAWVDERLQREQQLLEQGRAQLNQPASA